ncbi:hypothetical protein [Boseongicola sp. H5]|nr:hypothetical protein [Boseongicola sp. H5]
MHGVWAKLQNRVLERVDHRSLDERREKAAAEREDRLRDEALRLA